MNYLGVNLKKLLKKEHLSENELSKRIGIPQQIVNRIISGINQNPKLATIAPIANYFNISLHDLIYNPDLDLKKSSLSGAQAQVPYLDFKNIEQHDIHYAILHATEYVHANLNSDKHYFATAMNDDSMEPKFTQGTLLIFEAEKQFFNGDFCLLKDEKNQCMFRQIIIDSEQRTFIKCFNPINEAYTMIPLPLNISVIAILCEARTLFSHNRKPQG